MHKLHRRLAAVAMGVGLVAAPLATAGPASASPVGPGQSIVISGTAHANVALNGGGGGFSFTPTACVTAGPAGAGICTVAVSNGTFTNLVCGTGTAEGDVVVKFDGVTKYSGHFSITFAATVGAFTAPDAVGVVDIVPVAPATPPGCVTDFQVTAAAVTTG